MHKRIMEFLDEVCSYIKRKEVHGDIREELGEHINDLKEENIQNGYDEEKALERAISRMGNSEEIGVKLNRQHKTQTEWSLLILTALITVIGGIVLFAGSSSANGPTIHFSRYIVFQLVSIGTMAVFYFFNYTWFKKMWGFIYLSGVLLILITMAAGIQMNGVKRWLYIGGGYTVSVPELAGILFIVAFAGLLDQYRGKGIGGMIKLIIPGAFSVIMLLQIPSMAEAFIVTVTYAALMITSVARTHFGENRKIQFLLLSVCGIVPVVWLAYHIISNPYILERFMIYLPGGEIKPSGGHYYQHMANAWLSLSNWLGKTNATYQGQGFDMMPNITEEYILINVIATLGWAVGIILMVLIGVFIVRMFMTVNRVKDGYGFYLSLSACTMLSAQFLSNILMNFNLFPVTGLNMPFVSYGGTGYVVCMALVGVILSVWRRNNLISYQKGGLERSSHKTIFLWEGGRLTIDLKAWRDH